MVRHSTVRTSPNHSLALALTLEGSMIGPSYISFKSFVTRDSDIDVTLDRESGNT